MKATSVTRFAMCLAALALLLSVVPAAHAQTEPSQRQLRTYIPPDQLVSFLPTTPFNQFVEFLNPIFKRVTGKQIVDPDAKSDPIGISISGMHFYDAFELVVEYNKRTIRETDQFFIIEPAQEPELVQDANEATGREPSAPAAKAVAAGQNAEVPASLDTREVEINAVLFDMNTTKARELGIDWNVFFGNQQGSSSSGGSNSDSQQRPRFFLKTDKLFRGLDDYLQTPNSIDFTYVTQFFRLLENEGIGETVANPSVTVQSGEEGRIQIGSDIPIQTRDFAGNTLTQFFSTGIIIKVTPTLITEPVADSAGSPVLDFIHLNVQVEKSGSRPSLSGPIIDRNTADTKVLLLDGEHTLIGGLYSTEDTRTRRGIPFLKDLPGWFFGLRYVFGYEVHSIAQKELMIVLQARLLDPLEARARRGGNPGNVLEQHRRNVEDAIRRVDPSRVPKLQTPQQTDGKK